MKRKAVNSIQKAGRVEDEQTRAEKVKYGVDLGKEMPSSVPIRPQRCSGLSGMVGLSIARIAKSCGVLLAWHLPVSLRRMSMQLLMRVVRLLVRQSVLA